MKGRCENMTIYEKLKKTGDKSFAGMFESLQLLGFTVLYYNFDYSTAKMTQFNDKMHELNDKLLEDAALYDKEKEKIEKIWGTSLAKKVKEFPYRSKVHILGGLPKGGMMHINMAILEACSAIESFLILSFASLMEMDRKFGKVQMDVFYSNLKENSMNYAKGMKDEFIVQYFKDQINLTLGNK